MIFIERSNNNLTKEEIQSIQKYMKESSEKPSTIPDKLYHGTSIDNLQSILEFGLMPHEIFGEIHLCGEEKQVLAFIPKPCAIFSVETSNLDIEEIFLSSDHVWIESREFSTFTYFKEIEPKFLKWKIMDK